MALHTAVGDDVEEIGRATHFAALLNWVAAQPGAADGAYTQVLSVRPIGCEYLAEDLPSLIAELDALLALNETDWQQEYLQRWLHHARLAETQDLPLEFV